MCVYVVSVSSFPFIVLFFDALPCAGFGGFGEETSAGELKVKMNGVHLESPKVWKKLC